MRGRCMSPKNQDYKDYGGRGIAVCDDWNDYRNFLADMGLRPSNKHSIDRIDVNGGYSPRNCRWATAKEQGRNKRETRFVTVNGKSIAMAQLADDAGVPYGCLKERVKRGDVKDLSRPSLKSPVIDLSGAVFNRLTVIRLSGRTAAQKAIWLCECVCGKQVNVIAAHIKNGNTKSCGCLKIEILAARNSK